ncbi:DMT family transporter [Gemmobacter lutimaris]|uniref:DMT family transporter n=1 Tax=Gemmobacter lutimaris TaxID=2306023 RepID=A0A398BUU1_9RHOB|nr:DMT family transporter [Gemmobacter lutimaris]RID93484.1 DMT family transporter [Gemmobacter lutimaris]
MTAEVGLRPVLQKTALIGAGLVVVNTLISVSADAIAKDLITSYAAPQLMLLSGLIAVLLGLGAVAAGQGDRVLHTGSPRLVALRSALGAISTTGFFYALRFLPFAEIFVFIAIMPIFGAVLSGLVLRERLAPTIWYALGLGLAGMLFLFPEGISGITTGHWIGLAASLSGSASIVLSRRICKSHTHSMAQVFYAQLACLILGALLAPFVWQPMVLSDLALLLAYTLFIIGTRWLMVVILRMLPAYVVMQIANIQFLWMVLLGEHLFGEVTGAHLWVGSALVVASGLWLIHSQRVAPAR